MRITVDLAKASTEPVDLTGVLNPRVGDGDLKLPFHLMYNGDDYDMRGKGMDFLSEGSDQKKIYVTGTVDDSTKGDDPYTGNVTFTFPTGTFKTPGVYDVDKTMFRVVNNDDHSVISTVNVKMTVLPNDSDVESSDDVSYDSRMEKIMKDYSDKGQASLDDAKQKAQQIIDDANKQATDYLNEVKKQGDDLLDEIKQTNSEAKGNVAGDTAATATQAKQLANDNSGKIHDLQGEVGDARGRFMTLSDRENKQDFNIDRKEDKANANANYAAQDLRNDQQDKEIAKKANLSFITDYLSQMHLEPETFENEAALKAKYPTGKAGVMVTADNGHFWLWINGAWIDCGIYQAAGIPDGSITLDKLNARLQALCLPTVEVVDLPGSTPGYLNYHTGEKVAADGYHYTDPIPVIGGEEYRVNGYTYYDGRTIILKDGAGKVVECYPSDSADKAVEFSFTIPRNASEMIVNCQNETPTLLYKVQKYDRSNRALENLGELSAAQKVENYVPVELTENTTKGYWNAKRNGVLTTDDKSKASYKRIAVNPFEVYKITGATRYDAKLVSLIDYNGDLIKTIPESDYESGTYNVVIPLTAAYMEINNYAGVTTTVEKAASFTDQAAKLQSQLAEAYIDFAEQNYNFDPVHLSFTQKGFWDKNGGFTQVDYIGSTDKITVKPFEIYQIDGYTYENSNIYEIFNEKGETLEIYPNTSESLKEYQHSFVIPADGKYLVVNRFNGKDVTLRKATGLHKAVLPTTGKKWIAIGDSWTAVNTLGAGVANYTNYVAERLGLNMVNAAIGGTGYVGHNKDADDQFYNREIPADGDAYTILGSFNDVFVDGFKFGDVGDTDKLSLWGAMKATIDHIYSVKDNARIGIIAPGPWGAFNPQNGSTWSKLNIKSSEVGEQYVATMKKFADYYSLPFLDLYHQSNLRPWDVDYVKKYFHNDNTHPNTEGHKQFAPMIADFVNKLL